MMCLLNTRLLLAKLIYTDHLTVTYTKPCMLFNILYVQKSYLNNNSFHCVSKAL